MVPGKPAHLKSNQNQVLKFTSAEQSNALKLTYAYHRLMEVEMIKFVGLQ
jgi:hypothetical protein